MLLHLLRLVFPLYRRLVSKISRRYWSLCVCSDLLCPPHINRTIENLLDDRIHVQINSQFGCNWKRRIGRPPPPSQQRTLFDNIIKIMSWRDDISFSLSSNDFQKIPSESNVASHAKKNKRKMKRFVSFVGVVVVSLFIQLSQFERRSRTMLTKHFRIGILFPNPMLPIAIEQKWKNLESETQHQFTYENMKRRKVSTHNLSSERRWCESRVMPTPSPSPPQATTIRFNIQCDALALPFHMNDMQIPE